MKHDSRRKHNIICLCLFLTIWLCVRPLCEIDEGLAQKYQGFAYEESAELEERFVGNGSIGAVYLTEWLDPADQSTHKAVIKVPLDDDANQEIRDEADSFLMLKRGGFTHIPELYSCFSTNENRVFMITSYLSTSFTTHDSDYRNPPDYVTFFGLSTLKRLRVYRKMAVALEELFNSGFVHGDIKASNIMMDDKSEKKFEGDIKLIDFGATARKEARKVYGGTPTHIDSEAESRYCFDTFPDKLSPKQLKFHRETAYIDAWKADVWAFAATIYELEASRKNKKYVDAFAFMSEFDCAKMGSHANQSNLRKAMLKDNWLVERKLNFSFPGAASPFKTLLDDMTKMPRSQRVITPGGVRERLDVMIAALENLEAAAALNKGQQERGGSTGGSFLSFFCMGKQKKGPLI